MWSASAHRSCSAGHCLSTVSLDAHKQQPGRPWEHALEAEARACVVWEQDDLEKRSESGRSCDSTGRAAESILPVRGGEVNSHAELRPVFWIPFKCFCDPTLFPPAPTAVATATAQLYLSLTPTIGACSPSAEEGMPEIETWDKTRPGELLALSREVLREVLGVVGNLVQLASPKFCGVILAVRTTRSSADVRELESE
jgi:hypothetical protein